MDALGLYETARESQTIRDHMRHYETLLDSMKHYEKIGDIMRHYETVWMRWDCMVQHERLTQ